MSTFKVYASAVQAQADADATWTAYYAAQILARGLQPGDSLDRYVTGAIAPHVTVAYCKPYVASPVLAALRVDSNITAAVDTTAAIDGSLLPAPLAAIVPSPLAATSTVSVAVAAGDVSA